MGIPQYNIMKELRYLYRLIKGESAVSIISSMPEEDFKNLEKVAGNLPKDISRQQRRKISRDLEDMKR